MNNVNYQFALRTAFELNAVLQGVSLKLVPLSILEVETSHAELAEHVAWINNHMHAEHGAAWADMKLEARFTPEDEVPDYLKPGEAVTAITLTGPSSLVYEVDLKTNEVGHVMVGVFEVRGPGKFPSGGQLVIQARHSTEGNYGVRYRPNAADEKCMQEVARFARELKGIAKDNPHSAVMFEHVELALRRYLTPSL